LSDEIVLQKAGDLLIDDRILAFLKEICKGPIYTNNQDFKGMKATTICRLEIAPSWLKSDK
jgi:hypothetical protein